MSDTARLRALMHDMNNALVPLRALPSFLLGKPVEPQLAKDLTVMEVAARKCEQIMKDAQAILHARPDGTERRVGVEDRRNNDSDSDGA